MSEDMEDLREPDPAQLYRSLSDLEALRMTDLKIKGDALMTALRSIGNKEASVAMIKVEEAVMWGIKAIIR